MKHEARVRVDKFSDNDVSENLKLKRGKITQ